MSKDTLAWLSLVDAAVEKLRGTRRTFVEEEALRQAWEAGYDISPQDDPRFVLVAEADGKHPQHWRLKTHILANNRLIERLRSGEWDGRDIDQHLAQLDTQYSAHSVFCPVDQRFTQLRDGTYALTDQEPDIQLPPETEKLLTSLGPALQERWRAAGTTPQTTRALTEEIAMLGWSTAAEGSNWLLVRAWLSCWSAVTRVGQDYWMLADALPQGPAHTRLSVLPIRTPALVIPQAPTSPEGEHPLPPPSKRTEIPQASSDLKPTVTPPRTGLLANWVETLRTVHLTQGFLPVPAAARSTKPPRAHGAGTWEALPGTWFETGTSLWVWLDRDAERLCGPDLADALMWCEAGQKLRVDWNTDGMVFRLVGEDAEVQQEETRLVDLETLAALRGGLGESYRHSLFDLLSAAPLGLTFREIVGAIRTRQGHVIHRGTIRALLSTGGFAKREGRWYVTLDDDTGARQLRAALAQTLLEASTSEQSSAPSNKLQDLRILARAIQMRFQKLLEGQ